MIILASLGIEQKKNQVHENQADEQFKKLYFVDPVN